MLNFLHMYKNTMEILKYNGNTMTLKIQWKYNILYTMAFANIDSANHLENIYLPN